MSFGGREGRSEAEAETGPNQETRSMRVLVIDDEDVIREIEAMTNYWCPLNDLPGLLT